MHPRWLGIGLIWIALIFAAALGCRPAVKPTAKPPKTTREYLGQYAELRRSRLTENAFLRDELFRIEAESGLPQQFTKPQLNGGKDAADGVSGPLKSIATASQLNHLDRRLGVVFPQAEFIIAERHMSEVDRLSSEYSELRKELERFSRARDWTIDLHFDEGALFVAHYLPCIETALKLELCVAGLASRKTDWQSAKEGFTRAWRSIEILAAQPHLESRVTAAKLRAPALRLLETLLNSPACETSEVREFRDLLAQCLHRWPADDLVWRGERARALHFFEMIRDGQALSLADEELQSAIDDHGGVKDFGMWLHKHVDADEVYFLEAMRRMIKSCETPFADRITTLADLQSDLQRQAKTDSDPLLSRAMLLGEVEAGMKWQASDRLHCEVMLIALDHAVGEGNVSRSLERSPLTGRPYRITSLQRIIRVDGDSEVGELGYLVSTPRHDLEVARADVEVEVEAKPAPERPKRPAIKRKRSTVVP